MTRAEQCERRKAIAKAAEGATMPELCKRFHVGLHTVYDACREHGTTPRRSPYPVRERVYKVDPLEVLAKLKAGWSGAQVGRECGLTRERVRQIKQRARKLGLL